MVQSNPYSPTYVDGNLSQRDAPGFETLPSGKYLAIAAACFAYGPVAYLCQHLITHRRDPRIFIDLLNAWSIAKPILYTTLLATSIGWFIRRSNRSARVPLSISTTLSISAFVYTCVVALRVRGLFFAGKWSLSVFGGFHAFGIYFNLFSVLCCAMSFFVILLTSLPHRRLQIRGRGSPGTPPTFHP